MRTDADNVKSIMNAFTEVPATTVATLAEMGNVLKLMQAAGQTLQHGIPNSHDVEASLANTKTRGLRK